jgi:hypothetical protein
MIIAPTKIMRIFQTENGFACIYNDTLIEGGTPYEVEFRRMRQVALFERAVREAEEREFICIEMGNELIGLN